MKDKEFPIQFFPRLLGTLPGRDVRAMGYWKDVWVQLGGGNAEAHKDECVCAACFADEGLRGFVKGAANGNVCSFCGTESAEPIAAPLVPVLLYINECLLGEYDAAENQLSYDSESGSYLAETWTTIDLLEEHLGSALKNDDDGRLMEALCDGLGERVWCRAHPLSLTRDEKLMFSWDEFCELIKHRRRYFFLREEGDGELFSPLGLLKELEEWCRRFEVIVTLPAGHLLYRARHEKAGRSLQSATELGPPPADKATVANRMSPAGIVMFYVSDEAATALREVARNPKDTGRYAIGIFLTLRDVPILDLTAIPRIPSIFEPVPDSLEYAPRPPLIFLSYFAAELSMPIAGDERAHIEYIPAQVVTEYFRAEFDHKGESLAGIRYRSARHEGGSSLVLFASQDNLTESRDPGAGRALVDRDAWIELVGRERREVTAGDMERWERDAPQVFEWV